MQRATLRVTLFVKRADLATGAILPGLLEQGEHALLRLVGLRQHGCRRLGDDLGTRQFRRCLGIIGIQNPAARSTGILRYVGQIVSSVGQAIDACAEIGSRRVDPGNPGIDRINGCLRMRQGVDAIRGTRHTTGR